MKEWETSGEDRSDIQLIFYPQKFEPNNQIKRRKNSLHSWFILPLIFKRIYQK